jgi:hypothetical protein
MTDTDTADSPPEPSIGTEHDRNEVADELEAVMEECKRKGVSGRVRDAENERVRVKWVSQFVSAAGEYRKLVADLEEAQHEARIERLENMVDEID